ncbi:GntR family transcriptional regulator [Streptomyces sp. B1866]|uniref:GntR family transcriptional regulator n=1 Tax=Streptomyces sp. B1866 TaxID=3075431 RepID=UPI00288CC5BE|nr:GntR family transcriptional regulator [Streptomyces sp. B1866]MDT3395236.1 GntR family transcriptional regulator [Streptomyces sp. B1866]
MAGNRYEEIADDIRQEIRSGMLKADDRLPSEPRLAKRYAVSVPTVREALELLQNEGLIEKRHGHGNIVRRPLERIVYTNGRSAAAYSGSAFDTALSVTVTSSEITAEDRLSALLRVTRGSRLTEYVYLSRQGESPHSLARVYVPCSVAVLDPPPVSVSPLGDDIRDLLAASGVETTATTERLTARLAVPAEAKRLRIGTSTPVLAVERVSMDATGRVVEAALLVLPGHRAEAVFTTRSPAKELETTG